MTSALYKDWVVGGFSALTPEQYDELMFRVTPGVAGWSEYRDELHIAYAPTKNLFMISDSKGPICSTSNVEALVMLLVASGLPNTSPRTLLKLQGGVRVEGFLVEDTLHQKPEQVLAPDADAATKARAQQLAASMRERMSHGPAGKPGSGTDLTVDENTQVRTVGVPQNGQG